jgi:putative SOS response-associated peptidase YedK
MRWGLVPAWWKKSLKEMPATFNARAESVTKKPRFRTAFKERRCIVPASGFFEWTGEKGSKQPHLFTAADGSPLLAFAGLWDRWKDPATGSGSTQAGARGGLTRVEGVAAHEPGRRRRRRSQYYRAEGPT